MLEECKIRTLSFVSIVVLICLAHGHRNYKRQIIFKTEDWKSSTCRALDKSRGQCMNFEGCKTYLEVDNIGRQSFCRRYHGKERQVCCPIKAKNSPVRERTSQEPKLTTNPNERRRRINPFINIPGRANETSRTSRMRESDVDMPKFLPKECGISKSPKSRVIGGREAEKGSYPWMAVIMKRIRRGVKTMECGGSLVTNIHVLTAAHCIVDDDRGEEVDPKTLIVRLGEHNLYSKKDGMNPIEVPVESIHKHENYVHGGSSYINDIAVLKLARPVNFTKNIFPICLPYNSLKDEDLAELDAIVAGWGSTAYKGPTSDVLREASIPILSQEVCRRIFDRMYKITDSHLCAGTMDGSKDSCGGDSGGPLMLPRKGSRFYLVGIVSLGYHCAKEGYPGIYTRVSMYLNWLAQALS